MPATYNTGNLHNVRGLLTLNSGTPKQQATTMCTASCPMPQSSCNPNLRRLIHPGTPPYHSPSFAVLAPAVVEAAVTPDVIADGGIAVLGCESANSLPMNHEGTQPRSPLSTLIVYDLASALSSVYHRRREATRNAPVAVLLVHPDLLALLERDLVVVLRLPLHEHHAEVRARQNG